MIPSSISRKFQIVHRIYHTGGQRPEDVSMNPAEEDSPLETTERAEEASSAAQDAERLKKEHAVLDEKILALENVRYPSPEEQRRIKLLKKEKLAIKTQIETLEGD